MHFIHEMQFKFQATSGKGSVNGMREKTVCKRMDLTALWKNNVSWPSKNALQKRQLLREFLWFWRHLFLVSALL